VDLVSDRVELTRVAGRCDDEEVGDPDQVADIEDDDVGGLLVLCRGRGVAGEGLRSIGVDGDQGLVLRVLGRRAPPLYSRTRLLS
jgi:hypothetical protein